MSAAPVLRASCVVVAFHDPESLADLLPRLRHQHLEVVVVNVETDTDVTTVVVTDQAAATPGGNKVVEVALDANPGYAAAVNRGVDAASGPVVVFMNDDVSVNADAVLALAAVVAGGEADVAVPAVRTPEGDLEPTIAPLVTPGSLVREWLLTPDRPLPGLPGLPGLHGHGHHKAGGWFHGAQPVQKWRAPSQPEPIQAACAVVVAVRAATVRRVPLPEAYFLYWEESEWFWRLRAAGASVQYRPEVEVVHAGGRADVRPDKSRLLARNAVRCVLRTQGRAAAALAVPVVVAWNLRLVVTACLRTTRRTGRRPGLLAARLAGLGASVAAVSLLWTPDRRAAS